MMSWAADVTDPQFRASLALTMAGAFAIHLRTA